MRSRLRPLCLALVTVTALAGCTTSGASKGSTTASSTSRATTSAGLVVRGAPAGLAAAVSGLYGTKATGEATATLGSWHGSRVAVVTKDDDVTLAVGSPAWKVVGGWWPSLGKPTPQVGGKRFVAALGSDARVQKGQKLTSSRADAIQVIGMDGAGGGGLLGMARDLWVPLSTGGHGKINSAMVFGGPAAQVKTIAGVTGLPVQGYVLMGFDGVTGFIDAMGGLPIIIDKPIHGVGVKIDLTAGPHVLTGAQVLAYARERKALPDGDFGRSRHQSLLILAGAIKAKAMGVGAVPKAITALDKRSVSNLSAEQMLTFAAGFYILSPTKVGHAVAKGSFGTVGGQSVVLLDNASRRAFASFRDGRL